VRALLERRPNLQVVQGTVAGLAMDGGEIRGVVTLDGRRFSAGAVVITAGTFLRGVIHLGLDTRVPAGRAGDSAAVELAQVIQELGVTVQRFKTGTPPRIDGRSVDFARLERQDGDTGAYWFSFYERSPHPVQLPCYLTWTGDQLRDIISSHLSQSALYGGSISSRGPRYCPSIEDKIVKFPDAARHQVFLEPEGLDTSELYVNGLSTSLPPDVQLSFLRSVPGLEKVRMTRPGYAIEYDYFPPTQLRPTLELRAIAGLFLAGQVNGTTGYEEAAGQGVIAGINAAAHALGRESVVVGRESGFIGVLVDDLVSRGVDEPYRLFTSRSEYRLSLRQDNALRRLLPVAERLGVLEDEELRAAESRLRREEEVLRDAESLRLDQVSANQVLSNLGSATVGEGQRVTDLARRPGVPLGTLLHAAGVEVDEEEWRWADIELKYSGYLHRERMDARRLSDLDDFELPAGLPYESLGSLSFEAREKLQQVQPRSLGHASRIPGVSRSDLQNLVAEVVRRRGKPGGRAAVSRETH
jgi:tRNA uridine 5-carboxymethylaminomethyl modification enzyme